MPKNNNNNNNRFSAKFIDTSESDPNESQELEGYYCPHDYHIMSYFQDIGHYFCPECRFFYKTHDKQGYTLEQIREEKTKQLNPDNNNNTSGKITTNRGTIPFGTSTFVKSDQGRNVDVVAASFTARSRTVDQVEEAKRKAGYDKELEKLEKEYGYTIVSCSETVLQPDGKSSTTNYYERDEQ